MKSTLSWAQSVPEVCSWTNLFEMWLIGFPTHINKNEIYSKINIIIKKNKYIVNKNLKNIYNKALLIKMEISYMCTVRTSTYNITCMCDHDQRPKGKWTGCSASGTM